MINYISINASAHSERHVFNLKLFQHIIFCQRVCFLLIRGRFLIHPSPFHSKWSQIVFILLIRSLYQLSRPGSASCPGPHLVGQPICTLHIRELAGTSHAPPHHLGALVLSAGPGQSSDIREWCCVVFALYGFLKAYCLAQTRGSKLWTYWIFQLFAFNQKSLTPSDPISQLVPFFRHLRSTSLMLPLLDFCPSEGVRPGLQSLLHRDCWELAPGGGSSRKAMYCPFPGAHCL